jgi:hypothetical protein
LEASLKIKSIGTGSAGKTAAMAVMVVTFVIGLVISLGWLVFGGGGRRRRGFDDEVLYGPLAFIAMPIFFGLIAFVLGFVLAVIFNTAAGITGGIEVEVDGDDADAAKRGKEFDW